MTRLAPTFGDWLFSLKTFMAALTALYIAFWLDLPQPYWAFLTVLIVAQPYTGMVRSKALYRFVGTFVAGGMAVFLVPNLVDFPGFLTVSLAAWIGLCLYLSLIDGTPRSYAYMLAGYTAALIGFPSVLSPGTVFATAVARLEEVSLGILATFVINELFFPRSAVALYMDKIRDWLSGVSGLAGDVLSAPPGTEVLDGRRHDLAVELAAMDPMALFAAFDMARKDRIEALEDLRFKMRGFLPLISEIVRHLDGLSVRDPVLFREIMPRLLEFRDWFQRNPAIAGRPLPSCLDPDAGNEAGIVNDPLARSLLVRLRELGRLWSDCQKIRHALPGRIPLPAPPTPPVAPALFRDHLLAGMSGIAVFATVILVVAFWRESAWPDGGVATLMAAIAGSFFGAMDDPVPAIFRFLGFLTLGSVTGILVLFWLLPLAHNFMDLALILAVVLIPAGIFQARPESAMKVLPFFVGFGGLLALSPSYSGHFSQAVNTALAQSFGVLLAAGLTRLTRSVGADWSVRRLFRADLRDLAHLARPDPEGPVPGRFAGSLTLLEEDPGEARERILERVSPLAIRLKAVNPEERRIFSRSFLHPGMAGLLVALKGQALRQAPGVRRDLERYLGLLADWFPGPRDTSGPLLREAGETLRASLGEESGAREIRVLLAGLEVLLDGGDRESGNGATTSGGLR